MAIKTEQDLSSKPTEFKISLSQRYTPDDLGAIGNDIIQYIRDRSAKGSSPGSDKKYSDAYAKSLNFKIAGKRKSFVDNTLSGNMLTELEVIKASEGELTIGYSSSNPEQPKAEGNIIGSYGKTANKSKARNFIKLTHEEIKAILADYPLRSTSTTTAVDKKSKSTTASKDAMSAITAPIFDALMEYEE